MSGIMVYTVISTIENDIICSNISSICLLNVLVYLKYFQLYNPDQHSL